MTKLRSHRKRQPSIIRRRCLEQKTKLIRTSKRSRDRHVHLCPFVDQRQHRIMFIKDRSQPNRFVRIRSILTQQRNQLARHPTLPSHATRSNQHQRLIARRLLWSRLQYHASDIENVRRQRAMPYRILRDKLQQRRRPKIILPFKQHVLFHQLRMILQQPSQPDRIARIQQIHGTTKRRILNPLVMRQVDPIRQRRPLHMPLQPSPARKPMRSSNRKLRVAQTKARIKDLRIRATFEARMKLANHLSALRQTRRMLLQQIFSLMFQMIEIPLRRENEYRHNELPFARPGPLAMGRK